MTAAAVLKISANRRNKTGSSPQGRAQASHTHCTPPLALYGWESNETYYLLDLACYYAEGPPREPAVRVTDLQQIYRLSAVSDGRIRNQRLTFRSIRLLQVISRILRYATDVSAEPMLQILTTTTTKDGAAYWLFCPTFGSGCYPVEQQRFIQRYC